MTADEEHDVRLSFGLPADIPMKDLGVVELRAGIPKRVNVGWGKHCTISATVLTNGSVQLNLLYESKGEVIDGVKTQSHSERSQVILPRRHVGTPSWRAGQRLALLSPNGPALGGCDETDHHPMRRPKPTYCIPRNTL